MGDVLQGPWPVPSQAHGYELKIQQLEQQVIDLSTRLQDLERRVGSLAVSMIHAESDRLHLYPVTTTPQDTL